MRLEEELPESLRLSELKGILDQKCSSNVLYILDAGVADRLTPLLSSLGPVEIIEPRGPFLESGLAQDLAKTVQRSWRGRDIVAIGGGQVMDAAKLATFPIAIWELMAVKSERAGIIPLHGWRRESKLTLIPTTLGTGSESSSSACLELNGQNTLVTGACLRGDALVMCTELAEPLAYMHYIESSLEALMRLVGPAIGDPKRDELSRREIEYGRRLLGIALSPNRCAAESLARISSLTHTINANKVRDPYCMRHWYIANEIANLTRVSKMRATRALLPLVWQRIEEGPPSAWGSASRLATVWDAVSSPYQDSLPGRASGGIAALGRVSDESVPWLNADVGEIADQCLRRWGGSLPMLGLLDRNEILDVIDVRRYGS